jgi:hypothetical protein
MTPERRSRYIAVPQLCERNKVNEFKGSGFADRLRAAKKAKKAQLDRFRALPGANDPAIADRNASRMAAGAARDARAAERKAAKQAEQAAIKAAVELKAAKDAEAAAERASRAAGLAAEQKTTRDARYAARKARAKK